MARLRATAKLVTWISQTVGVTVKCNGEEKGVITKHSPSLDFEAEAPDGVFDLLFVKGAPLIDADSCSANITSNNAHAAPPAKKDDYTWETTVTYEAGGMKFIEGDPPPEPEVTTTVELSEDEL